MNYVKNKANTYSRVPYWMMVKCVLKQFDGLYDGYKAQCNANQYTPLKWHGQLAAIPYFGDLEDIIEKLAP